MKEVRWFCNKQTGFIKTEDISNELRFFEELAKNVFSKGNADHVIYASKEYAKNGNDLECINFYNPPIELSDKEFEKKEQMDSKIMSFTLYTDTRKFHLQLN